MCEVMFPPLALAVSCDDIRDFYNGVWGKCFLGAGGILCCNTISGHWVKLEARLCSAVVQCGGNFLDFCSTEMLK